LAEQVEEESGKSSEQTIEELEKALVADVGPKKDPKANLQSIMT
jgi:hypothetical protein